MEALTSPNSGVTMALDFQHYPRTSKLDLSGINISPHNGSHQLQGLWKPSHPQTQLQFNRDVISHPANLAARFFSPCPITIEKLSTPRQPVEDLAERDVLRNPSPSVSFTVVSEERLNHAVQLAKRDVKRKHLGEKLEIKQKPQGHKALPPHATEKVKAKPQPPKTSSRPNNASKAEVTRSGARVYVYTADRNRMQSCMLDSPPTRDPGPGNRTSPKAEAEESEQEVKRLQEELRTYMQKIEELAQREHSGDVLDPDEEARGRIRQQERATRSARMLYVLQQQVKEIQNDLEQLSPQKIKHTKKSRTMSRLVAVHRGAIRALQLFVTQLSERGEQQVPALYKELGQLIRQLSLCTAKVEAGSELTASNTIISILQQVEDLDILLEGKMLSRTRKANTPNAAASRSPSTRKGSTREPHAGSPSREKKCPPPVHKQREPREEKWADVRRSLVVDTTESQNTATQTEAREAEYLPTPERSVALKSGLEALIQAGGLKGLSRTAVGQHRSKGVLLPERPQGFRRPHRTEPSQRAHFQEKTVAFMLKENHPPVREKKTPWVPPNPTSPPASPKRANWDRQHKRLNDSIARTDHAELPKIAESEKIAAAGEEAIRLAWLDSETARRMQNLDSLYREEISRIQKLRDEMCPPNRLPAGDPAGNNTLGNQFLYTSIQAESLRGKVTDKSLGEADPWSRERNSGIFLQDSTDLETMIQRMEEIEKYQETVRRRFNQIVYADPEFWAQEEKERATAAIDQRPRSPHPIRITKPTGQRNPNVEIMLEEPLEGDSLQINKEELVGSSPRHFSLTAAVQTEGNMHLSVPTHMMQSIQNYSERSERHLRLTSHEEVGGFNPWHISESLAEELMEETLDEIAAELHETCESYAEAVFTSEFLKPADASY
ncbi:protein moonraker isoform X3 [Ascaphus truei]